ncbi:CmpA/NrtA family ABC transporter substrate-binding protein [Craurococcus roseus]|uniref:CmpA/NrtA family ABC transporter substrate-binding protein n=1 Tax=Craurococcus roseus TaxID=77585 RepID=A0ABP3QX53_9PROT
MNRRGAIAATAALLAAARATAPRGAFAQGSTVPEAKKAVLGYIALTDAAPLVIAKEKGLFAKHGMPEVEVRKQPSWGAVRDKLVQGGAGGGIDGAHILTPMPYLLHAGRITPDNKPVPMAILARLNLNGQGISGAGMNAALGVRLDAGKLKDALTPESKVAMTFPGGTHDLWLRYWLAAGGINPAKDLKTITVPPPEMVANVKTGAMEAFCVGEPWNGQLVNQRAGFTAAITGELWKDHPEKALAMRADWVQAHPRAAEALTAAVIEAQRWCDEAAHKEELCSIVSREAWFNVPVADILPRLRGEVNYGDGRSATNPDLAMKFWRDHASYPFRSHDLWFLAENVRWGHLPAGADLKAMVEQVNREAVWRAAAERAGVKAAETPRGTSRGTETFFDGKTFDPENPSAYLASQPIKNAA